MDSELEGVNSYPSTFKSNRPFGTSVYRTHPYSVRPMGPTSRPVRDFRELERIEEGCDRGRIGCNRYGEKRERVCESEIVRKGEFE